MPRVDHATPRRPVVWWWWALVALTVVPILVAGVQRERRHWYPESDDATIVLLSHDTFSSHPPLLGMVSTGGAGLDDPELHHPGPLELYLLAPFTAVLGTAPGSTVGAVAVGVAAVVGFGLALRALGGRGLSAAGLIGIGLVLWGLGWDVPGSVWNPSIVALPFACFLALAVATAAARPWLLPWTLAVASFVMQTHLSYVGMTGLICIWVLVAIGWRLWRHPETRQRLGALVAWSVGVVVLLWAPPLLQQATGQPGNLAQIARAATGDGSEVVGSRGLAELGRVVGVPVLGLRPRPDIVAVWGPLDAASVTGLVLLAALVVGLGLVARRRGDARAQATVASVAVVLVAAAVTATRVPLSDGVLYEYYARWMWPVGALTWILLGWVALRLDGRLVRTPAPRTGRILVGAALVAAAIVALLPRPEAWEPWAAYRRIAGVVAPEAARGLPDGTYVVRFRGGTAYLSTGSAVVEALEAAGHDVRIDPGAPTPVFPWGERRRDEGQVAAGEVWVVSGEAPSDLPAGAEQIASAPTLTEAERGRFERDRAQLVADLARTGVRPGPRPARTSADRSLLAETTARARTDPAAALASGAIAQLAAEGIIEPPGGDLHRVVTDARLAALADEERVRIYLVPSSGG